MLAFFLLGAPRVLLDGAAVTFDTRKATALLAYLAVTGQPQQRDALAALLWPDADQAHARGALRRTLSVLHAALHRTPSLRIERDQVALCLGEEATCDVQAFVSLARGCAGHCAASTPVPQCGACLEQLAQGVALYQDHFMAGFSLRDSAAYDDWQFFEGEELRRTLGQALEALVAGHSGRHNWPQAITYARRRLALDTLHEPAHRQLMLLYAWSDQRAAALRQYQECRRILEEELEVPPLAETTGLYEAILNHQPPAVPSPQVDVGVAARWRPPLTAENGTSGNGTPESGQDEPASRQGPTGAPLAGRRAQWEALLAAYQAVESHGHLVVIEGEAGAGKTRLAQALLAHVRGLGGTAAAGTGYAGEEALAYAPVEQLLRQALEEPGVRTRLADVEPPWQQALRRLLPELLDLPAPLPHEASGSQAHFLEGITRALGGLLQGPHPGVVLLDDLHYADSATLDLLAYMVRRLHALPLLVIATWCTDEVPPNHRLRQMAAEAARRQAATVLVLPPLDALAIAELVAAAVEASSVPGAGRWLAREQQPALAARLFRETRGLPLFVVEYLDLLRSGMLDPLAADWPAPQGVRQFLYARMGGISETAQQLVSTAAVIGRSFDMGTVIAASGRSEEEGINALEELLARRLILEQGADSFDFFHAQLRSLIYEETSQVRRRLLHRRVAEALATEARRSGIGSAGVAAALAHHYDLAGAADTAALWAVTAGEHARKVYANREAISYFEKALALGAADTCAIHLHLGDLHTLQGEYSQALESYRLARAVCGAEGGKIAAVDGDIEHRLGRLHQRLGDGAQAARHFAAALQRLPDAAAGQRAVVLADWSLAAYAMHDMDGAVDLAQRALAQAQADGGQAVPARAYDILSLVARQRSDLPTAIEQAQRSLAAARRLNDPAAEMAALNSLALAHAAAGAEEEAIPLVQAALELCVRLGDRHHEAALHNNLADLYHACGQPDAAMHQLKQAVAIFAEVGAEAGPDNAEIWMLSEW